MANSIDDILANLFEAIENTDYTQILHRIPPDEIVSYIYQHKEVRKFDNRSIFKGFIEEYIQDQIMEELEALKTKVDRIEKKMK